MRGDAGADFLGADARVDTKLAHLIGSETSHDL